ncbi:hypothetical protein E2C01_099616 [Portunus trituberculatus]|uniref:Uncharacterized protein n=1 Tax=Portunus trituberculatus TaxID=210409 RepID=A0A5B7KHA2_PORTR|nr:hypothetical protein [Portunus trituberculatus]
MGGTGGTDPWLSTTHSGRGYFRPGVGGRSRKGREVARFPVSSPVLLKGCAVVQRLAVGRGEARRPYGVYASGHCRET